MMTMKRRGRRRSGKQVRHSFLRGPKLKKKKTKKKKNEEIKREEEERSKSDMSGSRGRRRWAALPFLIHSCTDRSFPSCESSEIGCERMMMISVFLRSHEGVSSTTSLSFFLFRILFPLSLSLSLSLRTFSGPLPLLCDGSSSPSSVCSFLLVSSPSSSLFSRMPPLMAHDSSFSFIFSLSFVPFWVFFFCPIVLSLLSLLLVSLASARFLSFLSFLSSLFHTF